MEEPNDYGVGLFILGSFFNHDCDPNVSCRTAVEDLGAGHAYQAKRDIREGEELTVEYIADARNLPWETRQAMLKFQYGFVCACELCKESERREEQEKGKTVIVGPKE